MEEDITFALDIGTRTIIGLLLEEIENGYRIINSAVREHETRAMLDGQIHKVTEVAKEVKKIKQELEKRSGLNLEKVAIAAAGRALKTVTQTYSLDLSQNRYINDEDVQRLELSAIKKAQSELETDSSNSEVQNNSLDYHFVGYSVSEYFLDGMLIGDLIGQRGREIEVELVATFLPRVVIDSLLSVINRADLEVEHLTLEPIAASQVVIPEEMTSFNLALVDIGAGTSDIALTRSGSMIGYAMVPIAGDEISETISEEFLIDYNSAESLKCRLQEEEKLHTQTILGEEIEVEQDEVLESIDEQIEKLAELIADKIIEINSSPPQAVIFIGGGSLTPGLKDKLAQRIDLDYNRIGVRTREDLDYIQGEIKGVNTTQTLTPLGIAVITRETRRKAVFVDAEVNGEPVHLLTISQPTVADALLAADIDIEDLQPSPGMGLTCTINGELTTIRGELGQEGSLYKNSEEAELETPVNPGDVITFQPAREGKDADALIEDVIPEKDIVEYSVSINGTDNKIKTRVFQNGSPAALQDEVKDGADINYHTPRTLQEGLAQIMEVEPEQLKNEVIEFKLNGDREQLIKSNYIIKEAGDLADLERPLTDGLKISVEESDSKEGTIADLLKDKNEEKIKFTFNESDLEIPKVQKQIRVNGEQVEKDYTIEGGDEIRIKTSPITIRAVLDYINYNISESIQEKLTFKLNGEEVDLSTPVSSGDNLSIDLASRQGNLLNDTEKNKLS